MLKKKLRGLRGSSLEDLINYTNAIYRKNKLALIEKIPTPITPIKINNNTHTISLAYFEKKSSVDYIGIVQGIPICFDAKETKLKSLPLHNIHKHQVEFMHEFQEQKGIAFLLVHFLFNDTYFYLPINILEKFYYSNDARSISYKHFDIQIECDGILKYLDSISYYLSITNI
jgi:recombination protein U